MMPRASNFGGSYWNDDDAGSRYANVDVWAENSNENIGLRGCSDDRRFVRARLHSKAATLYAGLGSDHGPAGRPLRPSRCSGRPIKVDGQPGCPASANTMHGPAERGVAAPCGRRDPRPALTSNHRGTVTKRYRNLIGRIVAEDNMREAYRLTARGRRGSSAYLHFKEFDALNLAQLASCLADGTYRQGIATEFRISDPKPRIIAALPFEDRVAQQAVGLVIGPIFDRLMLPRSFASRPGKGTHAGVRAVQAELRRMGRSGPVYFLKTDFSKYFASIDRSVLWLMIDRKISCGGTRRVLEAMVPRTGIGLPIGSLTSQILANVYAGALDRYLQQQLGERHWFRYMDDVVVLGHSSAHLRQVKDLIEIFARDQLGLRFSKWSVAHAGRGINFLGYRIWATHKLLRRQSVTRARRAIASMRAAGDGDRLNRFIAAWGGHARHADSHNLMRRLGMESDDA